MSELLAWLLPSSSLVFGLLWKMRHRVHYVGPRVLFLLSRCSDVRFSSSSLLRIPDGHGNQVLILTPERGHAEYLGPIGGVVKYRPLECAGKFAAMEVRASAGRSLDVPGDDLHFDLRVRCPRRTFLRFMKWYFGGEGRETALDALRREVREELSADPSISVGLLELANTCSFSPVHVSVKAFRANDDRKLMHYRLFNVFDLVGDAHGERFRQRMVDVAVQGGTSLAMATHAQILEGTGTSKVGGATRPVRIGAHTISFFKKNLYAAREDEPLGGLGVPM